MSLPRVTMDCKAAYDPELKFSASGIAVCTIRTVSEQKKREGDQWVDDKTCWLAIVCFKKLAENVAESIKAGDLLVVTGRLKTDQWENREGVKQSRLVLEADSVAASLQFRTIPHGAGRAERSSTAQPDPWAVPQGGGDDPPF